jgi:hypothetical protein
MRKIKKHKLYIYKNTMGGKNTTAVTKKIKNSHEIKNILKKTNKYLSDTVAKIIQSNITTTSNSQDIEQAITFDGGDIVGDLNWASDQDATVIINMSILQKTKLKNNLSKKITNKIKTHLHNQAKLNQQQLNDKGEPVLSNIVGGLSKTLTSLGSTALHGTNIDTKNANLKNLLHINNDKELNSITNESVTFTTVNKTITNLATRLKGMQTVNIKVGKVGGNVNIGKVSQKFSTKSITKSITHSGLTSKIITKFSGMDKSKVQSAISSDQKTDKKIKGLGDEIKKTFDGTAKVVTAVETPLTALIKWTPIIIGGVVIFSIIAIIIYFGMGKKKPSMPNFMDNKSREVIGSGHNTNNSSLGLVLVILLLSSIIIYLIFFREPQKQSTKKIEHWKETSVQKTKIRINGYWLYKTNTNMAKLSATNQQYFNVYFSNNDKDISIFIQDKNNKKYFLLYDEESDSFMFKTRKYIGPYTSLRFRLSKLNYKSNSYNLINKHMYYISTCGYDNFLVNTISVHEAAIIQFI